MIGIFQNASGAVAAFDQKTASRSPSENPDICTYELDSLGVEPCWFDEIVGYDPASDVLYYVSQNPCTTFDPFGVCHEVHMGKPKNGVVNVRIVIPIAYKNGTGGSITPEDTARFNKRISETYSDLYEETGSRWTKKDNVTYKVTAEVKQITKNTFANEGSDRMYCFSVNRTKLNCF